MFKDVKRVFNPRLGRVSQSTDLLKESSCTLCLASSPAQGGGGRGGGSSGRSMATVNDQETLRGGHPL
ncbi:hypothetical protein EYF80_053711 [Liparis tanakae]|uniref:Uncharacterized protein n=1 Tax=Liparis tanakae TaxID=230148 RepID=A0A4Z2F6Y5_9TELE|nr:hypothetical protein EYF80_053711 [Liparis tanakae]